MMNQTNHDLESPLDIAGLLQAFKLTPRYDTPTLPAEFGRSSHVLFLDTQERGVVVLRLYDSHTQEEKLESGNADFEVSALSYLSSKGMAVPSPLLSINGRFLVPYGRHRAYVYKKLTGRSIQQADMDVRRVIQVSETLAEMRNLAIDFRPDDPGLRTVGGPDFIGNCHAVVLGRYPELVNSQVFARMAAVTMGRDLLQKLGDTPLGIVHADFFLKMFY